MSKAHEDTARFSSAFEKAGVEQAGESHAAKHAGHRQHHAEAEGQGGHTAHVKHRRAHHGPRQQG